MSGTSIGKAQSAYLKTLHLEEIGESADNMPGFKLDDVEEALLAMCAFLKITAEKALDQAEAVDTHKLADSIQWERVEFMGGQYKVDISLLDYYKFVNSGVNGVKVKHGSPYSFKNMGVSESFRNQIRKWVIRHGLKARVKEVTPTYALGMEKKNLGIKNKFQDPDDQTAFVIARSIKRNGIKPTKFWDKSLALTSEEMKKQLAGIFIPVIVNQLRGKK